MKESTGLSPSERPAGLNKATVASLEDPYATKNQKRLASLILSIINCATQTGIMLEQWKETTGTMVQKEVAVNNIDKLRCICLLEGLHIGDIVLSNVLAFSSVNQWLS